MILYYEFPEELTDEEWQIHCDEMAEVRAARLEAQDVRK